MKIIILLSFTSYLYLRRSVRSVLQIRKIEKILGLYNDFMKADPDNKKVIFLEIASKRPLINEIFKSRYVRALTYNDFYDEEKFMTTYKKLFERLDEHTYFKVKYLNPKYLLKDIFFLPSSILGFLLYRNFKKPSFFVSIFTWTATILISAYASEIRQVIDLLFKRIIEAI